MDSLRAKTVDFNSNPLKRKSASREKVKLESKKKFDVIDLN